MANLFCGYRRLDQAPFSYNPGVGVCSMGRWRSFAFLWLVCLFRTWAQTCPAEFRIEQRAVPGGAELLTVFGRLPDVDVASAGDVPLIAVLRDTAEAAQLESDRLRYVWVLTSSRPTLLQRAASAIPFFYWRAGMGKGSAGSPGRVPAPVIDLSNAGSPVWKTLASATTQVVALDPTGALLRSSSRSYRNNAHDHRQLHLLEGLAVLAQLEYVPQVESHFSQPELLAMQARLVLAGQALGGLVSEASLPEAYLKQRTRISEERGHNWELLRQRAEANGLYFEPFGLNGSATQALLWIAHDEIDMSHDFDGQFLSLGNPYGDERLKNWTGYTKIRDGREMIPLALYSLDHPKVPLLLVDFRDTSAPRRREVVRHAAVDVVSGIIGYSKWGNWPYLAGTWTWDFIHARHGAATNRAARIRAYAQVRQWLAFDPELDPLLRADLQKRLEALGVNPLEDNVFDEGRLARSQYAALLSYVDDPDGLARDLERRRGEEQFARTHGLTGRAAVRMTRLATFGIFPRMDADQAKHAAP